jgi:hypothetical protein
MCAVSAIMDYGRLNVPPQQWTVNTFADFRDIIRRLDELDKKLNQFECRDPAKAEWMKQVEARLAKVEQKQRKPRAKRHKVRRVSSEGV